MLINIIRLEYKEIENKPSLISEFDILLTQKEKNDISKEFNKSKKELIKYTGSEGINSKKIKIEIMPNKVSYNTTVHNESLMRYLGNLLISCKTYDNIIDINYKDISNILNQLAHGDLEFSFEQTDRIELVKYKDNNKDTGVLFFSEYVSSAFHHFSPIWLIFYKGCLMKISFQDQNNQEIQRFHIPYINEIYKLTEKTFIFMYLPRFISLFKKKSGIILNGGGAIKILKDLFNHRRLEINLYKEKITINMEELDEEKDLYLCVSLLQGLGNRDSMNAFLDLSTEVFFKSYILFDGFDCEISKSSANILSVDLLLTSDFFEYFKEITGIENFRNIIKLFSNMVSNIFTKEKISIILSSVDKEAQLGFYDLMRKEASFCLLTISVIIHVCYVNKFPLTFFFLLHYIILDDPSTRAENNDHLAAIKKVLNFVCNNNNNKNDNKKEKNQISKDALLDFFSLMFIHDFSSEISEDILITFIQSFVEILFKNFTNIYEGYRGNKILLNEMIFAISCTLKSSKLYCEGDIESIIEKIFKLVGHRILHKKNLIETIEKHLLKIRMSNDNERKEILLCNLSIDLNNALEVSNVAILPNNIKINRI